MAFNAATIEKILKNLKDNDKTLLQCGALTYIRSNVDKINDSLSMNENKCAEMCNLILELIIDSENHTRSEASKTFHAVLKSWKHDYVKMKIFDSVLQINRKKRLKIFQFLETVEDPLVASISRDSKAIDFMNDSMKSIDPGVMKWISVSSPTENLQLVTEAESKSLSEEQEYEEALVNNTLALMQRLYKTYTILGSNIQKLDLLMMEKVVPLAYMGHKRQRGQAIKVLHQAIAANFGDRIKAECADLWEKYKNDLQGPYCKRMALLVKACELDWASQWSISIQILGTDLHRGAALINNLLSVEERAFKSIDTMVRRQAFVSWKLLVDNFALDSAELATARRIKLLCIPLTAKNSKTELIALTKLEVWWYLIAKLHQNMLKFADPVITQFLNFCFGPLGDTPLLSLNSDVIASPGKRFYKTKVVAVDALLQLLVQKQEDRTAFTPILEDRLPHSVSDVVFKVCYKSFLHSVGEAIVIMSQLQENEMRNREEIGKVLWTNLSFYVQSMVVEPKINVYKEFILVVMELQNRANVPYVNSFLRDVVIPELSTIANELVYCDETLINLMTKIMVPVFLKNIQRKHCDAIRCLLWQTIKPKTLTQYHSNTMQFLGSTLDELVNTATEVNDYSACTELWFAYVDITQNYMKDSQNINEGTPTEHNFKTIQMLLKFPFSYMSWANSIEAQRIALYWKELYKEFESKVDAIPTVQPNEIFNYASKTIEDCLAQNHKCYRVAAHCLEALLSTINYDVLLAEKDVPAIVRLTNDVTARTLHEGQPDEAECALKALSSLLITVYGHSPNKALLYMNVTCQTINIMIKTDATDTLLKEIISTWETVVSIFRGFGNLLDYGFLVLYKETIGLALQHTNSDIVAQAKLILDMKDNPVIVRFTDELVKPTKKELIKTKAAVDRTVKPARVTGSFLNRKIPSPRQSIGKAKDKEDKKLTPLPPEPDSQDFVVIKTDLKVDVNRLTEHQKESFKRRRDDIPTIYNDLSQSSSQNTEDLQQWFEDKTKRKESASVYADKDLNKENLITKAIGGEEKVIEDAIPPTKTAKSNWLGEQSATEVMATPSATPIAVEETSAESAKAAEPLISGVSKELQEDRIVPNNDRALSPLSSNSCVESPILDTSCQDNDGASVAKKLNFDSKEEFPDEKEINTDDKPILRTRRNSKSESAPAEFRNKIRTRLSTISQSGSESQNVESGSKLPKRGVKRKAASDTESESSEHEKRQKRINVSPSGASSNTAGVEPSAVGKRQDKEMSRLRIDMVFEGPLPSRRRSKVNDDFVSSENLGKRLHSPEGKGKGAKSSRGRKSDCPEKKVKITRNKNEVLTSYTKRLRKNNRDDAVENIGETQDESQPVAIKKQIPKSRLKRSLQESGPTSKSQTIDDESIQTETVNVPESGTSDKSDTAIDDSETPPESKNIVRTERVKSAENPKLGALDVSTDCELGDVVENSQESCALRSNNKIVTSKEKPNDTVGISSDVTSVEPVAEKIHPRSSSPINPEEETVGTDKEKNTDDKDIPVDPDDTFLDISAIRPQLAEDAPVKDSQRKVTIENKITTSLASTKASDSLFNFSSPKGNPKRFGKTKSYPSQGRAAHMLGLVTKLAVIEKEKESQHDRTQSDDENSVIKRNKSKESDADTPPAKKDRPTILKETEKTGSPSGSRQEKIFNNMKAADYASSPPPRLFGNLKNDGEKLSPNMDKSHLENVSLDNDVSGAKDQQEDGNVSPVTEKDELPMLEWSSANPPSLTASPSVSILKRIRPTAPDPESESTTPNKGLRKRVSFADPPVSKEMGYKIMNAVTQYKLHKLNLKNSLLKLKQTRFRMIEMDSDKGEKIDETTISSCTDVDMDCERENELLAKIAEDLEDVGHMETQDYAENGSTEDISEKIGTNNSSEVELRSSGQPNESIQDLNTDCTREKEEKSNCISQAMSMEETQTQDDIFNSSDEKMESPRQITDPTIDSANKVSDLSAQNVIMEPLKLNVTDDSVIGGVNNLSTEESNKSGCLEDTVDVQNMTSFNSSGNSDEIYLVKPVRTSTQGGDNVGDFDTLPVTDSVFASFPSSQETQSQSQTNAELARPELLNTTESIYPKLVDCQVPIETIVESLTNPLWIKNLSKYLSVRGIKTIGDMARLSEREVVRIPVKSSSKVDFVRKILTRFDEQPRVFPPVPTTKPATDIKTADYLSLSTSKELPSEICRPLNDILTDITATKFPENSTIIDVSAMINESNRGLNNNKSMDNYDSQAQDKVQRTSTTNSGTTVTIGPTGMSEILDNSDLSQASTVNLSNDFFPINTTIGTSTDGLLLDSLLNTVGLQTTLDELVDKIDIELVLKNAIKRSSAEAIIEKFKLKMGQMPDAELFLKTMRMLSINQTIFGETTLSASCQACGLEEVLSRLPDIFSGETQFFAKVIRAYRDKFKVSDFTELLNFEKLKNEICKKYSTVEMTEMLTKKLKNESTQDVLTVKKEFSKLTEMLRAIPHDVVTNHVLTNNALTSSSEVLDTVLKNNDTSFLIDKIEDQFPEIGKNIFNRRMTPEAAISYINDTSIPKEKILSIHKAICDKLSPQDLLDVYCEAMKRKLNENT